jgi:hypothetical protein
MDVFSSGVSISMSLAAKLSVLELVYVLLFALSVASTCLARIIHGWVMELLYEQIVCQYFFLAAWKRGLFRFLPRCTKQA